MSKTTTTPSPIADTRPQEDLPRPPLGLGETGFSVIEAPVLKTAVGRTPYLQQPGVVLIARPQTCLAGLEPFLAGFDPDLGFAGYLEDSTPLTGAEQLLKTAGQSCYASFGPKRTLNKDAARYFDNIKSSGHGSVLEHANYSLFLYGISRSIT